MFVTLFYGIADVRAATLRYANAGHNAPLLFRRSPRRRTVTLKRTGLPLGLFAEGRWGRRTIRIQPGDTLLLYTDGLTEAKNNSQEMFGEQKLRQVVGDYLDEPADALCDLVLGTVYDFAGDESPFDDITLIVVRREA